MPMTCCTASGYGTIFGAKTVDRDVRRYRRKGLVGSVRWLFNSLAGQGVAGRTVLEIGGGIGALQIELVKAGATHATNVEIVDSYEDAAQALIAEHDLNDVIDRRISDFAVAGQELPAADAVVMHRVICCYPDPDALTAAACAHSRALVALTVPRESWWIRLGFAAMNTWLRIRRIEFQAYVHPVAGMLRVAADHGFHLIDDDHGRLWQSMILYREPTAHGSSPELG